ncbi:4'-phosphopantetheinyl transferase [Shewanella waksmanii]|uniref:4'-phosphopantetheinyl transferase family protein n=1 Tax=Shewanella waksmanii TaxID=213783 RepID=UPI0037355A6A
MIVAKGEQRAQPFKEFISSLSTCFYKRFNVHFCVCHYSQADYHPQLFDSFEIEKPMRIIQSVATRQAEFLAGRYAAKCALSKLGVREHQVRSGRERVPLWPDNTLGSISHTADIAISVVSERASNVVLGVDIEPIMRLETAYDIAQIVMSGEEQCFFDERNIPIEVATTLTFSAKESLFKAIYPFVGVYLEFDASQVVFLDTAARCFQLKLCPELCVKVPGGGVFDGIYFEYRGHLITLIYQFNELH